MSIDIAVYEKTLAAITKKIKVLIDNGWIVYHPWLNTSLPKIVPPNSLCNTKFEYISVPFAGEEISVPRSILDDDIQ